MVDGNPTDHVAAIQQVALDVAFIAGTRDWPGCEREQLWTERVFAVLPESHALSRHKKLTWQDLASHTFIVSEAAPGKEIHDYLVRCLTGLGKHPEIHVQKVGRDNLVPLVGLSIGLTLVSEAMTAAQFPGVAYRPIQDEVLPFSAVWCNRNDNPALRRFLSLAKTISAEPTRKRGNVAPSQTRDPSP